MKSKNRLLELRIDKDLKQREVAEAIGITQRKYSYLETGVQELTEDLLIKIANYYGTSTDYILRLTDDPTPYKKQSKK